MAQWQTADAKQRFSELVDASGTHGPQVVMRHKKPVAVLISTEDYRRLKRQADANFGLLLAKLPFASEDTEPVGMILSGDA